MTQIGYVINLTEHMMMNQIIGGTTVRMRLPICPLSTLRRVNFFGFSLFLSLLELLRLKSNFPNHLLINVNSGLHFSCSSDLLVCNQTWHKEYTWPLHAKGAFLKLYRSSWQCQHNWVAMAYTIPWSYRED